MNDPAVSTSPSAEHRFDVVIVGAGFSGLLCTSYLVEAGFENICLVEMSPSVGGVWSHGGVGGYPGAACDVPAYVYLPFLDRTGYIPSRKYVSQLEIADYAEALIDHTGIRNKIRFSRKVVEMKYLGDEDSAWRITTTDANTGAPAEVITCHHIVNATGPLSSPRMPEIPGMQTFRGESFHTAQWDKTATLAGKRVGVVGTGASAAQVITTIVDEVASLHVFQRTPTWCMRREDEPTPPHLKEKFRAGGYGEKLRFVDWKGEYPPPEENTGLDVDALHDEVKNEAICAELRALIQSDVKDPELAKKLTPDYPFFCKRALFIDDYYTTFNKPHVTLVDDSGGVVSVDETGLTISRGEHYDLDVVIYATGFDSNFIPFPIIGRDGVNLADKFGADESNNFQMTRPKTLWGIHVEDMPNFYMLVGPQSVNPVTNITVLSEHQSIYVRDLLLHMKRTGDQRAEPTNEAVEAWSAKCTSAAEGKVWLRCNNWYMKSTKTDVAAGRERSVNMWLGPYEEYLQHLLGGRGGEQHELLLLS